MTGTGQPESVEPGPGPTPKSELKPKPRSRPTPEGSPGPASTPDAPTGRHRVRPLAGVLAAVTVSTAGTRVSAVALPWFVLTSTGSATRTGLAAFCEMTPYVLVKALTGPLVDRFGPRRVSWITDVVSALAVGLIPLLYSRHLLSFPLLLILVAVTGAVRGPGDLAKDVMVPEAAERSAVPLERATGLAGAAERLASTVGPAAGGALVAVLGPMPGLVVDAASFAAGSLIIAFALPRGMGRAVRHGDGPTDGSVNQGTVGRGSATQAPDAAAEPKAEAEPEPGYWARFGEGFRHLRADPLLLTVILMVGVTNLLDAGFTTVLVPVWARDSGHGAAAIGLIGSVWGATAVCGSAIAAAMAHRLRRRTVFFAGFLIAGAPRFLVLAAGAPVWAIVAVFAVGGLGSGFLNPIIGAVIYERIPRRLLGRVIALGDSIAWAGIPLGGLIAGAVVATAGLAPTLAVAGILYFLTTSLTGLRPEWREMDRSRGRGRPLDQVDADAGSAVAAGPGDEDAVVDLDLDLDLDLDRDRDRDDDRDLGGDLGGDLGESIELQRSTPV